MADQNGAIESPTTIIYVGNIGKNSKVEVKNLFAEYGIVVKCNRKRTYAFVHLKTSDVNRCINTLHGKIWNGKKLKVQISTRKTVENFENDFKIVFPPNFEFSTRNFSPRYYPQDEMPLMPKMKSRKVRLQSFQKIPDLCDEEVEHLAAMGFYYPGTSEPIDVEFFEKDMKDFFAKYPPPIPTGHLVIERQTICFCCGTTSGIENKYPRDYPVVHHLHCSFFELPDDKKHIKDSVRKFRGIQDIDLNKLNERRISDGKTPFAQVPEEFGIIPDCKNCHKNKAAVWFHNCGHEGYCIKCAKSTTCCFDCKETYHGLERLFYD